MTVSVITGPRFRPIPMKPVSKERPRRDLAFYEVQNYQKYKFFYIKINFLLKNVQKLNYRIKKRIFDKKSRRRPMLAHKSVKKWKKSRRRPMLAHRSVKKWKKTPPEANASTQKRQTNFKKCQTNVKKCQTKVKKNKKGHRHKNRNFVYHGHHGQCGYEKTFFAPGSSPRAWTKINI